MQQHPGDPLRRPGLADEIEAQFQVQEERRREAARLAEAESNIARLSSQMRRGLALAGVAAVILAVVVAAYVSRPSSSPSANPPPHSSTPQTNAIPDEVRTSLPPFPRRSDSLSSTGAGAADWVQNQPHPVRDLSRATTPATASASTAEIAPEAMTPPAATGFPTPAGSAQSIPVVTTLSTRPTIHGTTTREYEIKAALLAKFREFVKWPPNAYANESSPFIVGILGDDPFGGALDKMMESAQPGTHKTAIRRARNASELRDAQMIFISRSEGGNLLQILPVFENASVLTVSDIADFARQGGMIEFVDVEDKIRFRLNLHAARQAGLEVDRRLVQLAERVMP